MAEVVEVRLITRDPHETRGLGRRLGAAAEAGDTFLLEGEFGSGKTVLVQGLAEGLGVATPVASPSFIIINQHQGRLPLQHIDLYRVERLDPELEDTVADALDMGGVTAIEWPRLLPESLRRGATVVKLSLGSGQDRMIVLQTPQERLARAAERAHGAADPLEDAHDHSASAPGHSSARR